MAEKEFLERELTMQAIRNIRNTYSKAKNFVAVSVVDNILGEIADEVPAADVVEVVRCTDCKFRKTEYCSMYYECECGQQSSWEYDNYFCSFGVRKENL